MTVIIVANWVPKFIQRTLAMTLKRHNQNTKNDLESMLLKYQCDSFCGEDQSNKVPDLQPLSPYHGSGNSVRVEEN